MLDIWMHHEICKWNAVMVVEVAYPCAKCTKWLEFMAFLKWNSVLLPPRPRAI